MKKIERWVLGTPWKFDIAPEKSGWKTTFLLGFGSFSGAMLNFVGVHHMFFHYFLILDASCQMKDVLWLEEPPFF